jgi:hypothetical protein
MQAVQPRLLSINARVGRKKHWVMLFGAAKEAAPMAKSPKT